MFEETIKRALRAVFGGGADINAGNPLEVHDPNTVELLNSTMVLAEAGGTVTTTGPGTEDVVYINDDPQGEYRPEKVVIDFTEQTAAESTVVRLYYRIKEGGGYILKGETLFDGVQDPELKDVVLDPNRFGIKVTIERTAGAAKDYDYEVHYSD
jgi:hypothetical protein